MIRYIKIIPYVIIAILGISLYFGFRYMSNQILNEKAKSTILEMKNSELLKNLESKEQIANITINQLKNLENNTKEALNNTQENNEQIDSLILEGNRQEILDKINEYEECISSNSLKPYIKCKMDIK